MKNTFFWLALIGFAALIIMACSKSDETPTSTSSSSIPDYATTTLSGKITGTDWTFKTGRVKVPTSSSGSYWYYMTNDNLSNACSSTYTGTSSNPIVFYSRDAAPTVGETELGWGTGQGTVTFYAGGTNYGISKGKISIDTVTTTAVTGKMYAIFGSDTDLEINGTFSLSRCCYDNSTYSVCSE